MKKGKRIGQNAKLQTDLSVGIVSKHSYNVFCEFQRFHSIFDEVQSKTAFNGFIVNISIIIV